MVMGSYLESGGVSIRRGEGSREREDGRRDECPISKKEVEEEGREGITTCSSPVDIIALEIYIIAFFSAFSVLFVEDIICCWLFCFLYVCCGVTALVSEGKDGYFFSSKLKEIQRDCIFFINSYLKRLFLLLFFFLMFRHIHFPH